MAVRCFMGSLEKLASLASQQSPQQVRLRGELDTRAYCNEGNPWQNVLLTLHRSALLLILTSTPFFHFLRGIEQKTFYENGFK